MLRFVRKEMRGRKPRLPVHLRLPTTTLLVTLAILLAALLGQTVSSKGVSEKSPYHQHLPDCQLPPYLSEPYPLKKASVKGIVCAMVKDEEGFLSEWVAFYEMQGFSHIILYDDNSTQFQSMSTELSPWLQSGFVSIEKDWWSQVELSKMNLAHPRAFFLNDKPVYTTMKATDLKNMLVSIHCKKRAVAMGIDIHVPLDIDEYLLPSPSKGGAITVLDELVEWMDSANKHLVYLGKLNFSPTPHFHEPIHLLTLEAFQTRYHGTGGMSYYTSVSPKVAIRLHHPQFNSNTTLAAIYCCSFHGCQFYEGNNDIAEFLIDGIDCSAMQKERQLLWPKSNRHRDRDRGVVPAAWKNPPLIYHYARSLEKFAMKQASYASLSAGNESLGNHQGLTVFNFMARAYGTKFDDSALIWTCRLRRWIAEKTNTAHYLRTGDNWYRNPDFGKLVYDPRKRGRNGNGFAKKVSRFDHNPYPPGATYQGARPITASGSSGRPKV